LEWRRKRKKRFLFFALAIKVSVRAWILLLLLLLSWRVRGLCDWVTGFIRGARRWSMWREELLLLCGGMIVDPVRSGMYLYVVRVSISV
jgi:hypothetical protein